MNPVTPEKAAACCHCELGFPCSYRVIDFLKTTPVMSPQRGRDIATRAPSSESSVETGFGESGSYDSRFEARIEKLIQERNAPGYSQALQDTDSATSASEPSTQLFVCTDCGHLGHTVSVTRGTLRTEVLLWLGLVIPGIVYSLWRVTTRSRGCELCRGGHLIPASSPLGRKLLSELDACGVAESQFD